MKKVLLVLAIGAFAACNGSSSTESKVDSTVKSVDSAAGAMKDSVKAGADSAMKKIDKCVKIYKRDNTRINRRFVAHSPLRQA